MYVARVSYLVVKSFFLFFLLSQGFSSFSQCSSAPIAAAACSPADNQLASNANITSGTTSFGGSATFSNVTLSTGGLLRICGTVTLASFNLNGGTLIVENGGSLTIAGTVGASGVTIINRGSITVSGNLTLQGTNDGLWNDASTSVLTVGGQLTLDGSASSVVNRGTLNLSSLSIQNFSGSVCLQANSITNIGSLTNNTSNAVVYSGNGLPACVTVSGSASLNNSFTTSSKISVCSNTASSNWGAATVNSTCTSCAQVLSLAFTDVTAVPQNNKVQLTWTVAGVVLGSEAFEVQRSSDGATFQDLGSVDAAMGLTAYSFTDANINAAVLYYRIRASLPAGGSAYSAVVEVETGPAGSPRLYPNPAGTGQSLYLDLPSPEAGSGYLSVIDMAGRLLYNKKAILQTGNNTVVLAVRDLAAGMYMIRVILPGGQHLYTQAAVTGH